VGIVGGSKTVHGEGGRAASEGLYWRYEAMLKESESALGITMGAPGELLAIRTSIFRPIPEHIINDDFYLTCDALAQGYSTKYAGNAVTSETNPESIGREFSRRTRIAAGTWQTCATFSSLGSPSRGWVALGFLSHRIMRNIVVPLTLPAIWILSRYVGRAGGFGRLLLRAQNVAYLAAIGGLITDGRYLAPFTEFALINAAQICGGVRWMNGNQTTIWEKPIRDKWA
jgi:hypothetical protein